MAERSLIQIKTERYFRQPLRKKSAVLNEQFLSWTSIEAGLLQGLIVELLFFLIYINDLDDDLITSVDVLGDNTLCSSVVHSMRPFANNLTKSVTEHYKKRFTPDPSNQSQDILVTATRFEPTTT